MANRESAIGNKESENRERKLGTDQSVPNPLSPIPNPDIAISVRNLSKKYQLYETPKQRLKEALHPFRKKYHHDFWALREVSFEVKCGEMLGIIGRNGSGKSTLLQMICGTLTPTQGDVNINGRVSALLELGAGFNPEFTGRDNVYMNAAIIGLSHQEIDARFEDITSFADIGNFIDQPVKIYSSGMYVRLAFAVAINVSPDILVIDEALSVGDVKFQRKCYAKLEEFRKSGKTILFVSHSMDTINLLCDRAILLEKGQIVERGEPKEVTKVYHKMLFGDEMKVDKKKSVAITRKTTKNEEKMTRKAGHNAIQEKDKLEREKLRQLVAEKLKNPPTPHKGEMRYGSKKVEIVDFGILDESGERETFLEMGGKYTFFLTALYHEDIEEMRTGVAIKNVKGLVITSASISSNEIQIGPKKRGSILEIRFSLDILLNPGEYFADFGIRKAFLDEVYDTRKDCLHFKVVSRSKGVVCWGLVTLPQKVSIKDISLEEEVL